VTTSLAETYVDTAAIGAGLVAEQAADRKLSKYSELDSDYWQLQWKTSVLSTYLRQVFLSNLGNKIRASSGEDKETSFLF